MTFFRSLFLLIALLGSLAGSLAFSPLSHAGSSSNDILSQIQKKGEMRIGVSILPPWVMENKKGELIGFEIDIARQLAKDIGVKAVFKQYQWKQMIPALLKGDIDIIASGLSITPKRALKVNFSRPYSRSGYTLVSNLALTRDFKSIKELNDKKIYITAIKGSVSASLIEKVFPKATMDLRKTEKEASSAVVNGSVHAFIAPSPIPEFIAITHSDAVDLPLKDPLLTTKEAFAVNKGNQEMLNYLNSWIIAHKADKWIKSTRKYWFKSLKWQKQVTDLH
ncbi:MAG: transporter substrate-binding domain-containing protein [Proteobacteria bacterium]|nr:transporter substrate-binding domain-containing protein [Pseudomonadota bacterium]